MAEVGEPECGVVGRGAPRRGGELRLQLRHPAHCPADPRLVCRRGGRTHREHGDQCAARRFRRGSSGAVPHAGDGRDQLRRRRRRLDGVVTPRCRRSVDAPNSHPSGGAGRIAREPCPGKHRAYRCRGVHRLCGARDPPPRNRTTAPACGEGRPMDLEQDPPSPRTVDGARRSSADPARPDTRRIGKGMEAGLSSGGRTPGVRLSLPARSYYERPEVNPIPGSSCLPTRQPA